LWECFPGRSDRCANFQSKRLSL